MSFFLIIYGNTKQTHESEWELVDVLKKYQVPFLDLDFFEQWDIIDNSTGSNYDQFFSQFLSTLDKPNTLVKILYNSIKEQPSKLQGHASTLLKYFMNYKMQGQLNRSSITTLRKLPIFEDMTGTLMSLDKKPVYTLPKDIPHQGIDIFYRKDSVIFLKADNDFEELHDFIGCKGLTTVAFYVDFVFKHLDLMDDDMIAVHMNFIYVKYIKERRRNEEVPQDFMALQEIIIETLKVLPFLRNRDGSLESPCQFYSRRIPVFVEMCPNALTPEKPWVWGRSDEWSDFLHQVGVVETVSSDLFLSLAKRLEKDYRMNKDGNLVKKSESMVDCLVKIMKDGVNGSFLDEIRDVCFIAQKSMDRSLTDLHPQYNTEKCIAFRGSASSRHKRLLWTKVNLLPRQADLTMTIPKNKEMILNKLQIIDIPPVEMVAENLINVANHIAREHGYQLQTNNEVFKSMYEYLQNQTVLPADVVKKLSEEAVVLIGGEERLTLASKTVEILKNTEEIRPYLCRMPAEIGIFAPLLKQLGATETPTANQYVSVLSDLKKHIGEGSLSGNMLVSMKKAIIGLFTQLHGTKLENCSADVLYLPDENDHLTDARHLTFNDAVAYYMRMTEFDFVSDVKRFGFEVWEIKKCLKCLPKRLQPRFLSESITEELIDPEPPIREDDPVVGVLNGRISSETFAKMVLRLLHHEVICNQESMEREEMRSLVERLSVIRVFAIEEVRTHLKYKKVIPNSERERVCFLKKVQSPLPNVYRWHIYIKNGSKIQMELLVPLADTIDKILDGRLKKSALYLLPLFSCSDESMSETLDEYNINAFRGGSARQIIEI